MFIILCIIGVLLNSNKACNAALQQKTKKIRISPYENQFVIKWHTFTNHFFLDAHRMFRGLQNANERSRDQQTVLFRR